jgi:exodeoxyribonuclease V alpha subunit
MHLTVRMAWHDNNWNGCVCQNPAENPYCVGTHSLLSGRLERDRNLKTEEACAGKGISKLTAEQMPPCFWSINAFGSTEGPIEHKHPFPWLKVPHIQDSIKPYSVFTWPFKLSFNHADSRQKRFGNYPPDIEDRVDSFNKKFVPNKSILFFWLYSEKVGRRLPFLDSEIALNMI